MDPEDCPFLKESIERSPDGAFTRFYCVASDQGRRVLGDSIDQAMELYCEDCPVPGALEDAPQHATPRILFGSGYSQFVTWVCSVCGYHTRDLDDLEHCHNDLD